MKRNIRNSILALSALAILSSCKARKAALPPVVAVETPIEAPLVDKNKELLDAIMAKQATFNTISMKTKAELKINNNSNNVNMSIRIKNGEAIWISVNAGIEVARVLITPDSIKIMNRLQSEYIRKPFNYIHQFTSEAVDFKAIQSLFTGNAFPGTLSTNNTIKNTDGKVSIKGENADFLFELIFNGTNNLSASNLSAKNANQVLNLNYEEYGIINNQELPQTVRINSTVENKTISANLKYTSITLNEPVDFPFSVPKRFTVKD